ncbi:uncharacterized protein LOC115684239 isoform X4 [Syzygium oleosum]|uniref:uncharacterized protein LOC115684239 isoform X4 n=1 Tax=Syzygium oleosum TaxID=219896 RepID=UPI0024BB0EF4|nr:uncharacterized protein LOC115684239 isoform X4 [Syzygium oleosum]
MHRPIFGHSFAVLVAPILLSVLAFKFLNKKKVGVNGNAKDAGSGASGSSTVTTEADSSGSSSLTPPSRNHYEVFLSFRGLDTRKGFIDHLYNGLIDAGIHAFKDDNELRQGEKIRPDLLAAIKNSKILIPILSVNYGESSWCLDELVQIMECKNNSTGHIVLPIFYKVEVAHVRHQIGSFGKTFQERESRLRKRGFDPMILEKWKQALIEVSSLKGFNADGYEGELVKLVVRKVLNELKKEFELVISENLVEIDRHIKKVMEFVNNNSRATLFVGIHGMGGIGKTTFAKTIYNKLSNKFEHRSFIADIRESYKRNGPEYLQNQLIHDILKHTNQVSNRDEGIRFISSKFKGEKVLILLDDVDDDDQLMALARNHNWFSLGSIIIITTRNKSILDNAEVDYNYELEEMDEDISSILFSRHAFRKDAPPSEFDVLTRDVVSTTGGLPLSLEVLGSFLRDKKPNIWRDTIKKLRKVPHKKVQEKLKISYDALEYGQQQIFLDIACFFIGTDGRIASYMWDACDFFPNEGIEVLRSMSLIKVGDDHELIMHDQLRDLGRDIICKENEREPQYRSRLWDTKEVMEVLRRNKGTSKIEALCLHRYFDLGGSYTAYTAEQFKELTNLRFFQVNNANLTGDFQNLLPQLRWLKWNNCPSDFEVTNFHPKKLIVLDLSWNQILKDWKGWGPLKMATELKVLNLENCDLRRTPDLSAFKSLEILTLEYCDNLEEIHPSIQDIKTLISLNVNGCSELKELPLGVGRMEELRELLINDTNIREIPISRGCLMKLETLDASNCEQLAQLPESLGSLVSLTQLDLLRTGIEELPESIGSLKKLKTLDASYCASLAHISSSIGNLTSLSLLDLRGCSKLAQLPDTIGSLVSLRSLSLSKCHSLRKIPDSIGKLESLTELHLESTAIEELPEFIGSLKKLKTLDASYCVSLAHISSSIGNLTSLSLLDLRGCSKLAQLPDTIGSLVSLQRLSLSKCHSLRKIPGSIGKLELLTELHLESTAFEELPESIGSLKKLKTLDASYCASLAHISSSIGNLTSLSLLDLRGCSKLAQLPDTIGSLVSLRSLSLSKCHSLRKIPDSIGKLESLTELHLESTAIEELPEFIGSLKKLKTLDASYCVSLAHISSSIGNLTSLSLLDLRGCSKLAQLPDTIGCLVSLRSLSLSKCHSLRKIPDSIGKLESLTELHLESTAIEELPEFIGSLKKLKTLDASYCVSLAHISSSIGNLTSLSLLDLRGCSKLAQLPDTIGSLVSLQRLSLSKCHSLRKIPDSIGKLESLTKLHFESTAFEELPESIGSLKKLKTLDASCCAQLAHISNSIGHLTSLILLDLRGCSKLAQLPDTIGSLVSLQCLLLSGCHSLIEIPVSIGKLALLTELHLKSTGIMELPESMKNMRNLRMLDISGTPMTELLDDREILAELQELKASGGKNPEGPGELVSPNNLDLDKLQKLSELRSRVLALVLLKRPRTSPANNSAMVYQTADSEHVLKRPRPFGTSDEVNNLPVNILPVTYNCQSLCQNSSDDLPRNVVITLSQDSPVKSMDFHPVQQILLLVGTNMGDVMVWEVGSHARIALRKFKVWDLGKCSMALQASLANDYTASVNRVMWSADGKFFGVAYSKQMVHIYSYHGGDDIRNHLEIEAHVGSVNDLAFSYLNEQLCVVTSGEDRSIKVWDTVTGAMQRSFEGHEAPVYSICLHRKENVQFIFSTSADGKIKAWLYDNKVSIVDYDAPGPSSTKIAYSADGTRLFSSGTNKEGESYLVEWNESEGAVNRTYHGLGKRSGGVVQFDTTKNGFLAAGDEFMVKFWHMDNNNLLTSTDAEGGLPAFPCIRFNKEGILLAVSTSDDTIKILANADGIRLLRTVDNRPFDASRVTPGPLMKLPATATLGSGNATVGASLGDRCAPVAAMVGMNNEGMADVKPRIANESGDKWQIWKLTEINEPSQCCSMRLPDDSTATTVSRLIYTNSGHAILALSSNAVHKLWKWARNDQNLTGRATTSVVPQLWQPYGGNLMTNDTSDTNPEDAVPCFALSKNDSYLISVSGGKISLFNMMTFKTMTKFMPPPPPNNGIIAIGMEDSSIQVYDVHDDEVQTKLKGHKRIVIGFDLSTPLTVLVSSGSNSQTITTFIRARQAATFLAFLPGNSFIIAMGMEDSSIQIYDIVSRQVKVILRGHQKRITGLAFSNVLNVLVSSDADSQLCVWSTEGWEEEEPPSKFQQMLTRRSTAPLAITRVQFHVDQIHLLVVHETQIAIYEAPKLKCHKQWVTREASGPITDATYSCNGQSIYLSFKDGSIGVLTASELRLRCRINPAAYIPSNPSSRAYPLVIAAHPSEPNQFALGLTDGSVYVLEPLESEGEWGTSPPVEDGTGPSMTSGATSSDQPQR